MADSQSNTLAAVEGIIIPPPDIKVIVDKTAGFVAKHGAQFEGKIIASKGGDPKFMFLQESNIYNAYYKQKIQDIKEGNEGDESKKEELNETTTATTTTTTEDTETPQEGTTTTEEDNDTTIDGTVVKRRAISTFQQRALKSRTKEAPKPDKFKIDHPVNRELDVDIMKLTAQYTAAGGKKFLSGLVRKEEHNPQFAFLRPQSVLFSYFTSLVEQYMSIIKPNKDTLDELKEITNNRLTFLDSCVHVMTHEREEEEKKKAQTASDEQNSAYFQIDWHDFVVVETLTFDDHLTNTDADANGGNDNMDMDMSDEEEEVMEVEEQVDTPAISGIRIRDNYTPSINVQSRSGQVKTFIDPTTGAAIPIEQSAEHMRITTLDPRWKEERDRAQQKQKDSAFAEGSSIVANLNRLASKRADIFTEDAEDDGPVKKKAKTDTPIIWDGTANSVGNVVAAQMEKKRQQYSNIGLTNTASLSAPKINYGGPPTKPAMPPAPPMLQNFVNRVPQPPGPPLMRGPPAPPGMNIQHRQPPPPAFMQQQMHHGPPPMAPNQPHQPPPQSFPPPAHRPMHAAPAPVVAPPVAPPAPTPGLTATGLVKEDLWLESNPVSFNVSIQIPVNDSKPEWSMNGQVVSVASNLNMNISELKDLTSKQLGGIPLNKFQLKNESIGFMKDKLSLAYYNFNSSTRVFVHLKTRRR